MKFVIENVGKLGTRLGHITLENGIHSNKSLETPLCLLYTRSGCVPHLTYDVLQMVTKSDLPLQLNVPSVVESYKAIKAFRKGVASFIGFNDHLTYLTNQDSANKIISGKNGKFGITFWTKSGHHVINVDKFVEICESIQPNWIQVLSDNDTDADSSNKSVVKRVNRSIQYLDDFLERMNKFEHLKSCELFASIQGGYNIKERIRSTKETATRPVSGFVIDGFHNDGTEIEKSKFEDIKNVLVEFMDFIPKDKLLLMHGILLPHQILYLVEKGVDIFDTSYSFYITEKKCGLVFSYDYNSVVDDELRQSKATEESNTVYEIDLTDKKFVDDFSPIVPHCQCHACKNHTKAYINHLLLTSEMLGNVLLMIHNLHHYLMFFQAIRQSMASNKFTALKTVIYFGHCDKIT